MLQVLVRRHVLWGDLENIEFMSLPPDMIQARKRLGHEEVYSCIPCLGLTKTPTPRSDIRETTLYFVLRSILVLLQYFRYLLQTWA